MLRLSWRRRGSGGPPRAHWIEEKDAHPRATPSLEEVEGHEERQRAWLPNGGRVALGGLLFAMVLLMACSTDDPRSAFSGNQVQPAARLDESLRGERNAAEVPDAPGPAAPSTETVNGEISTGTDDPAPEMTTFFWP